MIELANSDSLARMLSPDGNPIGVRFRNTRPVAYLKEWLTVIGVVPDVVDNLLAWAAGKPPLTPVAETPWRGAKTA